MVTLLPMVILVVAFLLGIPIAFSMAGAGILGVWLLRGDWEIVMSMLGGTFFSTVAQHILTTIPMFILMAYFSSSSGLARDLYTALSNLLSRVRGGLAIATVFACMIFGAMSGASVAAASVMSEIAMPNMRRFGYSEVFASGVIGVGSTLDSLIPPSVGMVIYGIMTGASIGKLLIAGVIPGIVLGILLVLSIFIWVKIRPSDAPQTQQLLWTECWRSLRRIWPSILLILLVLVLLYTGVATPTEVGALGAFLSAVIGFTMGRLTLAGAVEALKQTLRTTAMIFMILIGATLLGYYITQSQVPQKVIMAVTEMSLNRWVVVAGIILGYFVVSMFMDEIPLMIITLQLAFPLVVSLGFDPIWFGVITILMVAMGLVFPPVGLIAFIVSATTKVDVVQVYKGTSIMTIAIAVTTVLIMIFPEIALWLPSMMRG